MQWLADEFKKENGVDLMADKMALQRLKDASEQAKKDLSSSTSTNTGFKLFHQIECVVAVKL